jgi:uncharacterized protein (TIGR03000 family)
MIPGIGQRMAWVIEVYGAPKVNPPGDFPQIPVPAASAPHPAAAMIIVRLPAKATLSVNGKPVAAPSGETRIAVRNLDPKNIYEYRLQASVHRDNRTVLEERTISFQAGTRTVVDFGAANKPASLANSR